ncbi:MAG: hypothetical protein FWC99_01550 [Coriobacteriia bacterium]|nr:hypothetical protein [Coriobacteriia bacterium]
MTFYPQEVLGAFLFALFMIAIQAPVFLWLIAWKNPLNSLNRSRIYQRKDLRVKPGECDEVLFIRALRVDKKKYLSIRESFFAMKMDYAPTDEKIDHLLRRAQKSFNKKLNRTEKELTGLDCEILASMKEELAAGNLEVDNFTVGYEVEKSSWLRHLSVKTVLIWAFIFASPILIPPFFINGSTTMVVGVLASENVLRRSRDEKTRRRAKLAQRLVLIGTFWIIITFPIMAFVGWLEWATLS